jgi:hypothetical protein
VDQAEKAFTIAELLKEQIQLAAAEKMYRRALAGYEKALGAEHTSTLDSLYGLYAVLESYAWNAKFRHGDVKSSLPPKLNQILQLALIWRTMSPASMVLWPELYFGRRTKKCPDRIPATDCSRRRTSRLC